MRLRLPHAPYVANKIAIDLAKSGFVTMTKGIEPVAEAAKELLEDDLKKEAALEERVKEIIEENEEEIEFMLADPKQLFWMIKKKLAPEYGVILDFEDRYNDLAHKILDRLYEDDLIRYDVPENKVKNIIFNAIMDYIGTYEDIEEAVLEKISHYKRKLIPGSEEFEMVFQKMYEDELKRRGML
ncbi:DUF507 family protein [Nitrosophilus alvini]|uniref:DUF507 family protein n=1 Tax=Nitrosophilus alvini TaxID=2714855 RepID=UPI0019097AFA|nr:DUF507 family protein [Nitrosophilus alvini]